MVASSAINFFTNTNSNAPQLHNAYGSMINVLDACLVNGIAIGSISSLTATGTTVTAVFSAAHNLIKHQTILISGATQSEYNGEFKINAVPNTTTITFNVSVAPMTSPATGTISAKLRSLGWEKPFSSVNGSGGGKAAYRSKNTILSSRPYLRVVDELDPSYLATYAKNAKVGIVEDMTDIDTMLGVQAPYDSAAPNKNWMGTGSGTSAFNGWAKWTYAGSIEGYFADSTAPVSGDRPWVLVGNENYFYLFVGMIPTTANYITYGFGNFKSFVNADTSNTFLAATFEYVAANNSIFRSNTTPLGSTAATSKFLILRNYAQTAQYIQANAAACTMGLSSYHSGVNDSIGVYTLTNVAPFFPVFINETVLRGEVPGLYWLLQKRPYSHMQIIEYENEVYMAINTLVSSNNLGQLILKIGGVP
ncbi:hypothetical protein [Acinetobacter sp. ANC 3832]|uniref:hypothetical protein n=1 Tax=Acinetobacter sp. ANC 3832 TaxID=1977874 RepID=UPI000A34799A|nr:hypothetical protein [Acinetobacter sp. ANC 3832]OTG87205.1 hypothetical protein B9T35_17775 [Acinetobacter sp. ANC 3832]